MIADLGKAPLKRRRGADWTHVFRLSITSPFHSGSYAEAHFLGPETSSWDPRMPQLDIQIDLSGLGNVKNCHGDLEKV